MIRNDFIIILVNKKELELIKGEKPIVLILGDMLDLGDSSKAHHLELGKFISELNFIDKVYCKQIALIILNDLNFIVSMIYN